MFRQGKQPIRTMVVVVNAPKISHRDTHMPDMLGHLNYRDLLGHDVATHLGVFGGGPTSPTGQIRSSTDSFFPQTHSKLATLVIP